MCTNESVPTRKCEIRKVHRKLRYDDVGNFIERNEKPK